ncbi:MAG: hypothetical protein IR158_03180 [Cellulomonas sp.]|uniref:hypothetical protein n=1 Tax=Cellulomonas sp. TaxID=40001 RepID=UPI0019D8AEC2|nr:hypothetical protein [Cellulomonas sp.]MBF0686758.1 hypothetical protein [Cellulomonas sp.]
MSYLRALLARLDPGTGDGARADGASGADPLVRPADVVWALPSPPVDAAPPAPVATERQHDPAPVTLHVQHVEQSSPPGAPQPAQPVTAARQPSAPAREPVDASASPVRIPPPSSTPSPKPAAAPVSPVPIEVHTTVVGRPAAPPPAATARPPAPPAVARPAPPVPAPTERPDRSTTAPAAAPVPLHPPTSAAPAADARRADGRDPARRTVHVRIDRIVVRADAPIAPAARAGSSSVPQASAGSAAAARGSELAEYLASRTRGSG